MNMHKHTPAEQREKWPLPTVEFNFIAGKKYNLTFLLEIGELFFASVLKMCLLLKGGERE